MRRRAVRAHPEPRGGVRLGIEVDEKDALARLGEASAQVDRCGGLPDPALLVRDRVDARAAHARKPARAVERRARQLLDGHTARLGRGAAASSAMRAPAPPYVGRAHRACRWSWSSSETSLHATKRPASSCAASPTSGALGPRRLVGARVQRDPAAQCAASLGAARRLADARADRHGARGEASSHRRAHTHRGRPPFKWRVGQSSQASGRFFATPGRRGKPAGVGSSFRTTTSPSSRSRACQPRALRDALDRLTVRLPARARGRPRRHRDEGQAELDRDRRPREGLRERHAVRLDRLLLGAAPDDLDVRKLGGEALEERALASLRLEERERPRAASTRRAGSPASRLPIRRRPPRPRARRVRGKARSASSRSTRRAADVSARPWHPVQ